MNGPPVVGCSPNITHPRVQVWGACLEKVWRVLGDILTCIMCWATRHPHPAAQAIREEWDHQLAVEREFNQQEDVLPLCNCKHDCDCDCDCVCDCDYDYDYDYNYHAYCAYYDIVLIIIMIMLIMLH